jgi:hypothetical protein
MNSCTYVYKLGIVCTRKPVFCIVRVCPVLFSLQHVSDIIRAELLKNSIHVALTVLLVLQIDRTTQTLVVISCCASTWSIYSSNEAAYAHHHINHKAK